MNEIALFKKELTEAIEASVKILPEASRFPRDLELESTLFGRVSTEEILFRRGNFEARINPTVAALTETSRKLRSLGGTAPLNLVCPAACRVTAEPDYADVALDIYGDAATAATKLQAQLDRADELEIPEGKRRWELAVLVETLRERAEATSDPALQRTAKVTGLVYRMAEDKAADLKRRRGIAAAAAAESYPQMVELKRLVAEHKAVNEKRGIINPTAAAEPSALFFDVKYSVGWATRNTKHNGKIRELQKEIACHLGCYNRRASKVDFDRFTDNGKLLY